MFSIFWSWYGWTVQISPISGNSLSIHYWYHVGSRERVEMYQSWDQNGRKESVQGSKKNGQPVAKKCDEKGCKSLAYMIVMVQEEGSRKACALENEEYSWFEIGNWNSIDCEKEGLSTMYNYHFSFSKTRWSLFPRSVRGLAMVRHASMER